jgi:hypothetical protein
MALLAVALRNKRGDGPMKQDLAQDQTQPQESVLSTALWTGGVLLVVALIAIYAAM